MSEELELREQNPEISFFAGPIACIQTMFNDWYLIRNLVKKDLRARYKRAALGYGWTFLEPFLLSAVYYALFTILAGNPEKLYSMWVLLGVIVWGHFSRSLQGTVACLSRGQTSLLPEGNTRIFSSPSPTGSRNAISHSSNSGDAVSWCHPYEQSLDGRGWAGSHNNDCHGCRDVGRSIECNFGRRRSPVPIHHPSRILRLPSHVDLRDDALSRIWSVGRYYNAQSYGSASDLSEAWH